MSSKKQTKRPETFEEVCAKTGKNVADYAVPETASYAEKVAIRMQRCKLVAKALNGDKKIEIANTDQWKHYPWFWINPEADAPGGFRLSFCVSGSDDDGSGIGVRPYYIEESDSDFAGTTFLAEYEALLQDEAMALLED